MDKFSFCDLVILGFIPILHRHRILFASEKIGSELSAVWYTMSIISGYMRYKHDNKKIAIQLKYITHNQNFITKSNNESNI